MRELCYTVPGEKAGITVYSTLRRELSLSATLTRRCKHQGGIFVNGEPAFTNRILSAGDVVTVGLESGESGCDLVPETGEVEVLWENDCFLAVNKPAGLLVHPSHAKYTGTLSNFVSGYLLEREGSGVCHAVNRLDRDTGGVVLFGKSAYAKSIGAKALASAEKTYLAVAYGIFPQSSGVIEAPIGRIEAGNMKRAVMESGQYALTRYEVLGERENVTLLRFRLETGRTHQIRVHSAFLGHPLMGDGLYGSAESCALSEKLGISSQLLHAQSLSFSEPRTGEAVLVEAPIRRKDFSRILQEFEKKG